MNFFIFFLSRIFFCFACFAAALGWGQLTQAKKKAVLFSFGKIGEKNIKKSMDHFFFIQKRKKEGGNRGIRTLGPCLAKAVLYQLSYIPIFAIFFFFAKQKKNKKSWTILDLNQ